MMLPAVLPRCRDAAVGGRYACSSLPLVAFPAGFPVRAQAGAAAAGHATPSRSPASRRRPRAGQDGRCSRRRPRNRPGGSIGRDSRKSAGGGKHVRIYYKLLFTYKLGLSNRRVHTYVRAFFNRTRYGFYRPLANVPIDVHRVIRPNGPRIAYYWKCKRRRARQDVGSAERAGPV